MEPIKAFGYTRVSGLSQVGGDGPERQRLAIGNYATAAGIEIVEFFSEDGVCGATEWENRPAWVRMLACTNGIRTVVVERLDRLARDLMVQEHILADLKARGISLVSTAEPDLDSDSPTRVMFRQIMGAVAQYDRAMTVLKLAGARQRIRAAAGRCEGRKPYGGHPDRPEEKEIWARIMAMRAGLMTTRAIADKLNDDQVPTRMAGGRWHSALVARIVKRG